MAKKLSAQQLLDKLKRKEELTSTQKLRANVLSNRIKSFNRMGKRERTHAANAAQRRIKAGNPKDGDVLLAKKVPTETKADLRKGRQQLVTGAVTMTPVGKIIGLGVKGAKYGLKAAGLASKLPTGVKTAKGGYKVGDKFYKTLTNATKAAQRILPEGIKKSTSRGGGYLIGGSNKVYKTVKGAQKALQNRVTQSPTVNRAIQKAGTSVPKVSGASQRALQQVAVKRATQTAKKAAQTAKKVAQKAKKTAAVRGGGGTSGAVGRAAARTAAEKAKKVAQRTAREAKSKAKEMAITPGSAAVQAAKAAPKVVAQAAKKTGQAAKSVPRAAVQAAKAAPKVVAQAAKKTGRAARATPRAALQVAKKSPGAIAKGALLTGAGTRSAVKVTPKVAAAAAKKTGRAAKATPKAVVKTARGPAGRGALKAATVAGTHRLLDPNQAQATKKKTPSDFERYGLTDQPIKRAKDIRITSTKKKTPKHADEFLGTETVKRAKKAAADKKSTAASKKLRDVPPRKTQRVFDDVEGYDRMTGRYSADTPTAKISLKDLLDSKNVVSDYEYEVGHKHGGKVYRRAGGSVRGWGKATRGY
jgi:hypothetical protein